MKNYYEILEVDINASSEVIDKAFKVLAKKYHPDTQEDKSKIEWAEEQFKLLNEAYEVLSDKEKREEYTKELEFDKNNELNLLMLKNADLEIQVENLQLQLEDLRQTSFNTQSTYDNNTTSQNYQTSEEKLRNYNSVNPQYNSIPYQTEPEQPVYYESYYHPVKSKLKSLFAFCITVLLIILVCFIIWKIPFTHNLLIEIYENNSIIQFIVKLFYK